MTVARWFSTLFGTDKPLIGVVHLPSLPGSIGHRMRLSEIEARVGRDVDAYVKGGVDGLIVENFGDAPFRRGAVGPHTVALMTRLACLVRDRAGERPVGINVLRNDGAAAIGVALAAEAAFVRVNVLVGVAVTDQGFIEGDAAALQEYRRSVAPGVRVFADYRVKHATQLRVGTPEVELDELTTRARADAVLVTGAATGSAPDSDALIGLRRAAGRTPLLIASGVSPQNIASLAQADGFIVGTALKRGGRTEAEVDPARVAKLARAIPRRR